MFELLDADGSGNISGDEFENFGFLFNFEVSAVRQIFKEFDVSGDQVSPADQPAWFRGHALCPPQELDYQEFRMFAMACIDRQNELQRKRQERAWWQAGCLLQ